MTIPTIFDSSSGSSTVNSCGYSWVVDHFAADIPKSDSGVVLKAAI